MYDSLLDARIRLQKCVSNMNRMPDSMHIPDYLVEKENQSAANTMLSEALSLVEDLFDLQEVKEREDCIQPLTQPSVAGSSVDE